MKNDDHRKARQNVHHGIDDDMMRFLLLWELGLGGPWGI